MNTAAQQPGGRARLDQRRRVRLQGCAGGREAV